MCPLTNANRKRFLAVSKGTNAHERGDDDDDQNDQNDDDFFDQKRLYPREREKKIGKDNERTETPTPTFSSLWEKKGVVVVVVVARVVFCVRVVVESDFDVESSSSSSGGLLEWRENSIGLFAVTPEKSEDERCRREEYQRHEPKLELERQF